jgi:hypothetical protein
VLAVAGAIGFGNGGSVRADDIVPSCIGKTLGAGSVFALTVQDAQRTERILPPGMEKLSKVQLDAIGDSTYLHAANSFVVLTVSLVNLSNSPAA